jgi:cytochrome c1
MTLKTVLRASGLLLMALPLSALADGAAISAERCAGCHALQPADVGASPVIERSKRAGPPLHYAGNKFQAEWLNAWLQQPQRLRPAGYFPPAHVQSTAEGDVVDATSLPAHEALDAAEAKQVGDYLMSLRSREDLVAKESYQPGSISLRMGMMDFRKFKGCNACHQDASGEGGLSGPELHSAWQRLQPAFLSSYIKDPTAWDPHTLMPVQEMNDAAVHKLVNYLKAIGEQ